MAKELDSLVWLTIILLLKIIWIIVEKAKEDGYKETRGDAQRIMGAAVD